MKSIQWKHILCLIWRSQSHKNWSNYILHFQLAHLFSGTSIWVNFTTDERWFTLTQNNFFRIKINVNNTFLYFSRIKQKKKIKKIMKKKLKNDKIHKKIDIVLWKRTILCWLCPIFYHSSHYLFVSFISITTKRKTGHQIQATLVLPIFLFLHVTDHQKSN